MNGADTHEAAPQHTHEKSFNSQQHVLLILLKDWADVLEDVWVEEVYTAVYDVAHKCAGLFHIMQDLSEQKTFETEGKIGRSETQEGTEKGFDTSFVSSFSTMHP